MIKVTDIVLEILQADEIALEAAHTKLLNLSAYAEKIHKRVEKETFKPVQKGTIVVALSRVTKNLPKTASLTPDVKLDNLSVKSSLTAITYKKSIELQRKISVLNPFLVSMTDIFSVTEGQDETTIIVSDRSRDQIIKEIGIEPKEMESGLVALIASFNENDVNKPNVVFALLSTLAAKRINVVEFVSTRSEMSFLVNKKDMEAAFKALNIFFAYEK